MESDKWRKNRLRQSFLKVLKVFSQIFSRCTSSNADKREEHEDVCPQTKWVEGSNYVDVNFKIDPRTHRIIMMGAIDNLVKGAAGQAVQNMNLMFGFKETEGLLQVPMYP